MVEMDRDTAIRIISDHYPPDSDFIDTAEIGWRLLEEARNDIKDWREESTEVLKRFAELCIRQEREEFDRLIYNLKNK